MTVIVEQDRRAGLRARADAPALRELTFVWQAILDGMPTWVIQYARVMARKF